MSGVATYQRYSDEFRASAVLMLEAAGYPAREGALSQVASHLGMPRTTLRRWYRGAIHPPPAEIVQKKRLDLRAAIRAEVDEIFTAMGAVRPDASYRDLAWAAGVLIDKLQLLDGKPTWRVELIDLLRDGTLTPDEVTSELGDDLARELFDAAGINRA